MTDPFAPLRRTTAAREHAEYEWNREIIALHALGFSTRAIAEVAGVSHDSIWRRVR